MEVVTIKTDYGTERRYYRPRWISTALRISGILFFSFSFVYSFFIHLANLYQVTTVCNVLFIALGLTKINWIKLCAQRPFIDLVERHCMGQIFSVVPPDSLSAFYTLLCDPQNSPLMNSDTDEFSSKICFLQADHYTI